MMAWFVIPFALIAGAFITVQAGSNAELKKNFGEPTAALLVNYVLGFGAVLIYGLATRLDWPGLDKIAGAPWWAWIGGLAGAVYGIAAILLANVLGAATLMAAVVSGQVICSVLLDHFGWIGFDSHTAGVGRIVGCA